ncbi:dihydrofolate synthase [Sarracenia purpurea var. burkii]
MNMVLTRFSIFTLRETIVSAAYEIFSNPRLNRYFSSTSEDLEMEEFTDYLDNLRNYEKTGVPKGTGTDSEDGFDLGRARRLMELLGNPQSKFKV